MGLIQAAMGAAGGVLADQWREYFYCESIPESVMAVKGQRRVTGRGSNKGVDNIISNGSIIAVADGQCMMIVEQGKIVELCAEPGEFVYDTSTEPSIFSGDLGDALMATFKNIGKRFTFGGEAPKDQRVYYFNTKTGIIFSTQEVDKLVGISLYVKLSFLSRNIPFRTEISVVLPLLFGPANTVKEFCKSSSTFCNCR